MRKRKADEISNRSGARMPTQMPTDFGAEARANFQPLDPSIVQAQSGQYFQRSIGSFGEADPTARIGDVITQQIAQDHHPATQPHITGSIQQEGDRTAEQLLNEIGITPDMVAQAQAGQSAIGNDPNETEYESEDSELAEIFDKLGIEEKDGQFFRK